MRELSSDEIWDAYSYVADDRPLPGDALNTKAHELARSVFLEAVRAASAAHGADFPDLMDEAHSEAYAAFRNDQTNNTNEVARSHDSFIPAFKAAYDATVAHGVDKADAAEVAYEAAYAACYAHCQFIGEFADAELKRRARQ